MRGWERKVRLSEDFPMQLDLWGQMGFENSEDEEEKVPKAFI